MSFSFDAPERAPADFLIAFADISGYTRRAMTTDDEVVAADLDHYYGVVAAHASEAGGHVVKYVGDAALIVFPPVCVDAGVAALLDLKDEVDAWLAKIGWRGQLVIKAHFGSAIAGPYGPRGATRFDILGANVNIAATVASDGFALTAEAFRKLSTESRKRFKKHTPPITYIRTEDRHRR